MEELNIAWNSLKESLVVITFNLGEDDVVVEKVFHEIGVSDYRAILESHPFLKKRILTNFVICRLLAQLDSREPFRRDQWVWLQKSKAGREFICFGLLDRLERKFF